MIYSYSIQHYIHNQTTRVTKWGLGTFVSKSKQVDELIDRSIDQFIYIHIYISIHADLSLP